MSAFDVLGIVEAALVVAFVVWVAIFNVEG